MKKVNFFPTLNDEHMDLKARVKKQIKRRKTVFFRLFLTWGKTKACSFIL